MAYYLLTNSLGNVTSPSIDCSGYANVTVTINDNSKAVPFSATISFEGSGDNITFSPVSGNSLRSGGLVSSVTGPDVVTFSTSGMRYFRVKVTNYAGGMITVSAELSGIATLTTATLTGSLPAGSNVIGGVTLTGSKTTERQIGFGEASPGSQSLEAPEFIRGSLH